MLYSGSFTAEGMNMLTLIFWMTGVVFVHGSDMVDESDDVILLQSINVGTCPDLENLVL